MAAYSITASSVLHTTVPAQPAGGGIAGEAIVAGEWIYLKASDSKFYKAQADGTTAPEAVPAGMAANSAAANQPVNYFGNGQEVQLDTALFASAGLFCHLSATAGKMDPPADAVATGDYITQLGYSTATNKFMISIKATGLEA